MNTQRRVGVTILLLLLGVATVAFLSPGSSSETGAVAMQSDEGAAPGTAGMRVHLDPETGEVTGDLSPQSAAGLDAELQNALRRDDEGLVIKRHANGAESMDLQGRYQSVSVVHVDENGTRYICTHDADDAEHAITAPISQPALPEVK